MKNPSVCPWQGLCTLPHAEHKQERHAESTLEPAQQAGFLLLLGVGLSVQSPATAYSH